MGMRTTDGAEASIEPSRLDGRNHSIRRPDIARVMTSCRISLAPSKIVWITLSDVAILASCARVAVNRTFARDRF